MSDNEFTKKLLRSVLQSSKDGVSMIRLQSEYKSLCGEFIPLRKLGFSNLEDYLQSISSVVRLKYHMNELRCFAVSSKDTAHIAELVAKQKSVKKHGPTRLINCRFRNRPFNPYTYNVRPSFSLRQPSTPTAYYSPVNRYRQCLRGVSASGDYRKFDPRLSSVTPVVQRQPSFEPAVSLNVPPKRNFNSSQSKPTWTTNKEQKEPPSREGIGIGNSAPGVYDVMQVQSQLTQLLQKYGKGLWLSKLSDFYSQMFGQTLHAQALMDVEKWTHICMVERPKTSGPVDRLIYPLLPSNNSGNHKQNGSPSTSINSNSSSPSSPQQFSTHLLSATNIREKVSPNSPLNKPTFIFPPQPDKLVSSDRAHSPTHNPNATIQEKLDQAYKEYRNSFKASSNNNQHAQPLSARWACNKSVNISPPDSTQQPNCSVLPLLNVALASSCGPINSLVSTSQSSTLLSADIRQRLKELLSKYSQGIWAHALPKLFMDTYQLKFPDEILNNLSLLLDICALEYPMPNNKNKAILYSLNEVDLHEEQDFKPSPTLPSGLKVQGQVLPPPLVVPSEQYPSVLVAEAKCSNSLTIRYVGEKYSNAQELMEDMMHSFYSQYQQSTMSELSVGQLVAVREEDEEGLVRAQVIEVGPADKVKVYYLDHGFPVETSRTRILQLHQDFAFLPFQATNVRLAGLEVVSSHPLMLSTLETLAVGKILLMEKVESCQQNKTPVVILYDTSKDDDVNINSLCRKALHDTHMNNPLCLDVIHPNVGVTHVCEDGIIHCQLPSRGIARLQKSLDEIEAVFISQNTSEFLVSRPFGGKLCLARYKRKWARAEITTIHGDRVIEILFIDFGISATVEITDLREIPPLYLKNIIIIPPQATKCRLADLPVPDGFWTPQAVLCLKEAVLEAENCTMKIVKKEEQKGEHLVYVYLFITADTQELHHSVNHQLAKSDGWQKLQAQPSRVNTGNLVPKAAIPTPTEPKRLPLPLPSPLEFPQNGQNLDVFVSVACHPGYFVLQGWNNLHKLVVLTGEMVLYYNQKGKTNPATSIEKGEIYAAKIDKDWHRVQVKAVLSNGFASVYQLDHGKHELVHSSLIWPLIEEFRQLPFQAIVAQLAGVKHDQWSEGAALLFRNHVENRALVAQVENVQEMSEVKGDTWERKLTVYLVDTTMEDKDVWVHSLMADIDS